MILAKCNFCGFDYTSKMIDKDCIQDDCPGKIKTQKYKQHKKQVNDLQSSKKAKDENHKE